MNKPKLIIKVARRIRVGVKAVHTTIPNDYANIENKPKINGVELLGDLSYSDLELLSSLLSNYADVSLSDDTDGIYILAKDADGDKKIPVSDFLSLVASVDTGSSVEVESGGEISQELNPGVFYNFTGDISSLTISFADAEEGRENEYKGQFSTGESAPTISFPNGIVWVGGEFPEIEAQKTYQFSVLNNVGVIVGV